MANVVPQPESENIDIKEINELLSLRLDPHTPAIEIRKKAEAKVKDIEEKITSLESMKHALVHLIGQCDGHGTVDNCPIIEALEN